MKFNKLLRALMLAVLTIMVIVMIYLVAIAIAIMTSKVLTPSMSHDIGILSFISIPFIVLIWIYYNYH